jgi:hypothetical protein
LKLEAIFKPKRTVPAEVKYVDMAISKGKGLSGELLNYLSKVDALIPFTRNSAPVLSIYHFHLALRHLPATHEIVSLSITLYVQ